MALDNISNPCLFGDKFEEKLLKDTTAKQKSKLIFSGLQCKSANNSSGTSYDNQPFRGSLPRLGASGGRGYFCRAASHRGKKNYSCIRKSSNKARFEACASSSTKSFSSGAEFRPTSSRQIKTFSGKLEKIVQRPSNFGISGRLSNPVFIRTKANETSQPSSFNKEGRVFSRLRNSSNVKKRCHSDGGEISESVLKCNIFGREKRLRLQASHKSEKTEPKYSLHSFQSGGSFTFKGASPERRLKDAYFSVALHKISQKYLRFPWQGNLYELLGLGPAPIIFIKLMKIPITLVRRLSVRLIIYLDDISVMGSSLEEIMMSRDTLIFVLQNLGFVINFQKSVLNPSHQIQFLGEEIDSLSMSVPTDTKERTDHFAMPESTESIRCLIKANDSIDKSSFINGCSSSTFAVPIFITSTNSRVSREEKLQCTGSVIKRSEGGNSVVDRKPDAVQRESSNLTSPPTQLIITSDASLQGWGQLVRDKQQEVHGQQRKLKLKAASSETGAEGSQIGYFNIYPYAPRSKVNSLTNGQYCGSVIYSQNGGNPQQSLIRHKQRDLGLLATERDHNYCRVPTWGLQSRSMKDSTEWKPKPQIFQALRNLRGTPDIDLFASRVSHQLPCYISWKLDPFSKGRDAFQISWKYLKGYAFPPFSLIGRVLRKVQTDQAQLLLVTPT